MMQIPNHNYRDLLYWASASNYTPHGHARKRWLHVVELEAVVTL